MAAENLNPWPEQGLTRSTCRVGGVPVDEKVAIGRVGVETNGFVHARAERRHERASHTPQPVCFVQRDLARDSVRINGLALVMASELHAVTEIGEAVEEVTAPIFPEMNRDIARGDHTSASRGANQKSVCRSTVSGSSRSGTSCRHPTARAEHQLGRVILCVRRADPHAIAGGFPAKDLPIRRSERRAVRRCGGFQMRADAKLRKQNTGARFEHASHSFPGLAGPGTAHGFRPRTNIREPDSCSSAL